MAAEVCVPAWLLALLVSGPSALAGLGGLMAPTPEELDTHRSES